MAITYTDNGGGAPNGSDLEFTYTFPVIQTEDVKVALNGVTQATTKYAVDNVSNPTKITFNNTSVDSSVQETSGAPKSGVLVRVYRETTVGKANGDEDPKAIFAAGSSIRATDLNANQEQALFAIHELQSQPVLAEQIDTGAITSDKILDGTIANADINASADIAGSKLANDSITGAKIADDQINSEHYVDGSIDTAHIGDLQITTAKIANGAITDAKIAGGSLDNRYYTETELDAGQLDNRYYTEAEADARFYNLASAEEIQSGETWTAADNKVATTAAIDARIIDLVDDVGGFVAIANETSFPTANPDVNNGAGTIVSVKAASTTLTPSGTTVTIANGAGSGNTVTITGVPSAIASGFGFLVETTTTLHTYTFHRLVPKPTEVTTVAGIASNITTVAGISSNVTTVAGNNANVTTVAGSIGNVNTAATNIASINNASANISSVNNFGDTYQVASSNPSTDGGGNALAEGDLYFNTTANELKVYNGGSWQGGVTASGNFASTTGNTFSGDNVYQDNAKLKLGTGSDLEIFHNGSNSIINDAGTGNLQIQTGGSTKLEITSTTTEFGGDVDLKANKVTTTTTNGNVKIEPNGTGVVEIRGAGGADGTLQLNCSAQSHGVKIKSPAHSAAASYTLTLPVNIVNGQFLKTDANGVLSWAAVDLTALSASNLTSGTIPDARFPATLPAVSGANLTNIASAEVYGFTGLANGTLQVTTTNKGADNISGADYAAFEDVLFAASGFTFSVNADGKLIATI